MKNLKTVTKYVVKVEFDERKSFILPQNNEQSNQGCVFYLTANYYVVNNPNDPFLLCIIFSKITLTRKFNFSNSLPVLCV